MTPAEPFAAAIDRLSLIAIFALFIATLAFGFAFAAWWKVGRLWLAVQLHAQSFDDLEKQIEVVSDTGEIVNGCLRAINERQEAEKAVVTDLTVKAIDHADRLGTAEGRIGAVEADIVAHRGSLLAHDNAIGKLHKAVAPAPAEPVGPPKDYYDPKAAGCCRIAEGETHWIDVESGRTAGGIVLPCEGRPATAADRASRDEAEPIRVGPPADGLDYFAPHPRVPDRQLAEWREAKHRDDLAAYEARLAERRAMLAKAAAEDNMEARS